MRRSRGRRRSLLRLFGRIVLRMVAAAVVLLVIAALAGLVVVQSGWFHEYVRQRIIADIEHATGGRVEIGRFSFRGPSLTASVAPLVLHGREPQGDPPLLQVESVTLSLRILSFAERKIDLASLTAMRPQVHIVTYPDGSNNLPGRSGDWPADLINLAIGRYEASNGVFELDERRTPLNIRGENLSLKLTYNPLTPSYLAELSSGGLRVLPGGLAPLELGFSSQFVLEKSRLVISALHLSTPGSRADLKGVLDDPREPHGTLNVKAALSLREASKTVPLPIAPAGTADFNGTLQVSFADFSNFVIAGRVNARGLGYSNGRLNIQDAKGSAQIELTANRLVANSAEMDALGAHFAGKLSLESWRQLHVEGNVDGLTMAQAADIVTPRPIPWNGALAGEGAADFTLGEEAASAHAKLVLSPLAGSAPVEGLLDVSYDQREGELILGDSYFATPSTRLDASGALGRRMEIKFRSTNLSDVLAVLPVLEQKAPTTLPLNLESTLKLDRNGSIAADGSIIGPLNDPRFQGHVNVANASVQGHRFDTLDAETDVARTSVSASRFTLARGATDATGTVTLTAREGTFDDALVSAQFNLRNANLEELAKEAGVPLAIQGIASAGVRLSGSMHQPQADLTINVANPRAFGESMDRVSATLKVTTNTLEVSSGEADEGPGRIAFSGGYQPSAADWKSGAVQLQVATRDLVATRLEALAALQSGLDATLTADVHAQGRVAKGSFSLSSAMGTLSAQSVSFRGQALGAFTLTAETRGNEVSVEAKGNAGAANLEGKGSWRLDGGQNGSATIRFSRMNVDEVHRLAMLVGAAPHQDADLPLEGFFDGGNIALTLALSRPADFQASVTLDGVQLNPKAGQVLGLDVAPEDVVLKSAQPMVIAVTAREARLQPARLTGRDTNLEISGTIPFSAAAGGANIAVRGDVNLAALQLLNPSLLARGHATVEAGLRGSLADPLLNGRMDLKAASLYLKDEPTGLENVTGGVLFNRNRATIDKVTAQIGSGTLALGGFVEFGSPLIYRLQAAAQQVRFRLPIDLSTTFSANLALNGTSDASTLSGTLTLNRASFTPRTDLDQLLAAFSRPVPEATPNDYLRGMQFDVRVASSPVFVLQTTLTRDVQADVDLRLRGTPVRPLVLGSVSVNSGQVQFFGNQYTINRGDIRFTNAVKIEPVLDLALETKVSGVTVNVTFTGTMDKLKTNFSSDPPLESSKVIALLAVGRDPSQFADATSAQTASSSANFVGAGGSLVSQALSAQLSSKLQRFFGASRVKIDPTMTGVDNTPQARLTFEQQVSKDVTMTYITNLNYTAEQIVRLQWDLNPHWSAIAVRDANGLFGIDFQYRGRFK